MIYTGKDTRPYSKDQKQRYEKKYRQPFLYAAGTGWCRLCNQVIKPSYAGQSSAFHYECQIEYDRHAMELREGITA